jgi:hypothetical protein
MEMITTIQLTTSMSYLYSLPVSEGNKKSPPFEGGLLGGSDIAAMRGQQPCDPAPDGEQNVRADA